MARHSLNIRNEEENEVKIPWYLFTPASKYKLLWGIVVVIFVVQTIFVLPLRLAWPESFSSSFWTLLDIVSDFVFIMDIFINFLYVQEDDYGLLIVDIKLLAKEYLKTWFFIDFFSSIPTSLLMLVVQAHSATYGSNSYSLSIRLVKLLKLITLYKLVTIARILRLMKNNKLIEYLLSRIDIPQNVKIGIASILKIVFMIHILGSIWIIIAELNREEERNNWLREASL